MATNNNGNLLDTAGEVAIDFVWGNFPIQPNDVRPDTATGRLDPALDNHIIALSGWNGYPLYSPDTAGEDVAGPTDYVNTPNVIGLTTASATDALKDASFATITVASAVTPAVSNVVLTTNVLTVTTSAAHGYAAGDSVVIASLVNGAGDKSADADLNGTYTIVATPSATTFTVAKTHANVNTHAPTAGGTAKVMAKAGTIKTQSVAAGQNNVAPGSTITITPYFAS
jgi:hypothetical protein